MSIETIQKRAAERRLGRFIEVCRAEGRAMAERWRAGASLAELAALHGITARAVQRRLFTVGAFRVRP